MENLPADLQVSESTFTWYVAVGGGWDARIVRYIFKFYEMKYFAHIISNVNIPSVVSQTEKAVLDVWMWMWMCGCVGFKLLAEGCRLKARLPSTDPCSLMQKWA